MPLLTLLVMKIVFEQFFGRNMNHYTTYLFCGNLLFSWFSESTNHGMMSLFNNSGIFTKVNVPKYLFLVAGSIQTLINFALTLIVFFFFCWLDDIQFTWRFVMLIYPIFTMMLFSIGIGLILSAFFMFFRDIEYLWRVFLLLLMYGSAIFYPIDGFSQKMQLMFACNPVYRHIAYFREIVLKGSIPSVETHLVLAGVAVLAVLIGALIYKNNNTKFLYYV